MIQPAFIVKQEVIQNFDYSLFLKQQELIYYGYDPLMFPEIWAPVECFDIKRGLYMVSTYGRLYSSATGSELCYLPNGGYVECALQRRDGTRKTYLIHRIVAYTFIPKTDDDIINQRNIINHKNLIRNCNFVWNLEYVTQQENIIHAIQNNAVQQDYSHEYSGLWSTGERTAGEANGMAEWKDEQVHIICQSIQDGKSYSEALILAGLQDTENARYNVSHIVQGKRWKSISQLYDLKPKWKIQNKSEFVIPVCKLLEQGYGINEIIEMLPNIPGKDSNKKDFIRGIKNRKYYIQISRLYKW